MSLPIAGAGALQKPADAIVLHSATCPALADPTWTQRRVVGELVDALATAGVRGLGYHALVLPDGRVVQLARLDARVNHAGSNVPDAPFARPAAHQQRRTSRLPHDNLGEVNQRTLALAFAYSTTLSATKPRHGATLPAGDWKHPTYGEGPWFVELPTRRAWDAAAAWCAAMIVGGQCAPRVLTHGQVQAAPEASVACHKADPGWLFDLPLFQAQVWRIVTSSRGSPHLRS